jgi:predicted transcriptional regulator
MMVDVLRAVRGGAVLPTRVMYRSNLSWSVCQGLLKHLTAKGLLETRAEGERRLIVLTPKGSLALGEYCRAAEEIAV